MKTQLVIGLLSLACVQGLFLSDALYTCCGPDDVWEADEGYLIGSTADGGTVTKVHFAC